MSDNLIIDYINRFIMMDVDARIQLFDYKGTYQFQTVPGVDRYNMPMYSQQVLPGGDIIEPFPIYQGFTGTCRVKGIPISFSTRNEDFLGYFPNVIQNYPQLALGDGGETSFTLQIPLLSTSNSQNPPTQMITRGHTTMAGIVTTGSNEDPLYVSDLNTDIPTTQIFSAVQISFTDSTGGQVVVSDSGQFLASNKNCGLLMNPGLAPTGNTILGGGYSETSNVVNYLTGEIYVNFGTAPPANAPIAVQCQLFTSGLPRSVLFYNNILTFRCPPDRAYTVELDAYLTPCAYLASENSIQFGYMCEYFARGAARKILSDVGDWEQFQAYEPLFREQESLVWKRSQRQFTSTKTQTIYSAGPPYSYRSSWSGYGGMN
jgi:hypothetical protein